MTGKKEKIILDFLKKNKNKKVYPVDIANYYNWDAWETFQRTQRMKEKGLIS